MKALIAVWLKAGEQSKAGESWDRRQDKLPPGRLDPAELCAGVLPQASGLEKHLLRHPARAEASAVARGARHLGTPAARQTAVCQTRY